MNEIADQFAGSRVRFDPSPRDELLLATELDPSRRPSRRYLAIVLVMLAACLAVAGYALFSGSGRPRLTGPAATVSKVRIPTVSANVSDLLDTSVMPLDPTEAKEINDERPPDLVRTIPAKAFSIGIADETDAHFAAALKCLAQAVYYEANGESELGERAVAQVVLNRVRHPAFPGTVCGVVYQGSERATGCQFSFTCDGSLRRVPSTSGFARALKYARDALTGRVVPEVGIATHYHADYVVPYWAPTLDKARTIGAHIFYQMRGFLGSPRAFNTRYDLALEEMPVPSLSAEAVDPSAAANAAGNEGLTNSGLLTNPLQADIQSGKLTVDAGKTIDQSYVPPDLRADKEVGQLLVGSTKLKADETTVIQESGK